LVVAIVIASGISCSIFDSGGAGNTRQEDGQSNSGAESQERGSNLVVPDENPVPTEVSPKPRTSPSEACTGLDTGEKAILKSQTFPIDFEPFKGSCFVTTHDPEFTDPPLGSEVGIFKDGTQIYQFDSSFDENSATCWVIAVGFRDINDDGLMDIVIAGKCGAKSGPIVTNEIQMNDGRGFYTNVAGNDELEKFTTIKEITDFARKNKQLFER